MKKLTAFVIVLLVAPFCYGAWDNDNPTDAQTWNTAAGSIRTNNDAIEAALGVDLVNASKRYDVTAYGATAGDSVDDTSFFALAITAAAGNTVYVPTGRFDVTGITLNQQVRLFMEPGAELFLIASSDTSVITVSTAGCRIEGGQIDGNRTNQTQNSSSGIKVIADNTHIKGVTVDSCNGTGIYALYASVDDFKVEDCIVTDTFEMGIAADTTTAGTNVEIINNHIDRVGDSPTKAGILVQGESASVFITGVRIAGNYVTHTADNTTNLTGITGRFLRQVVCSNNNVLGGRLGISIDTSKDVTQESNTVFSPYFICIELGALSQSVTANNIIDGAGVSTRGIVSSGIGTDEVRNIIIGNNITGIIGISIQTQDDADYLSVIGNNINHDIAGSSVPAIQISASDYFVCSFNIIKGDGIALSGIIIANSGPGSVVGNVLTNLATQGINIFRDDGNTQSDLVITNNVLENTGTPIRIVLGSGSMGDNVIIGSNPGSTFVMHTNGHITVQLSSAEIKDLADTPIELVPAQGGDTLVEFVSATLIHDAAVAYAEPSAPDDLVIEYEDGDDVSQEIDSTGFLTVTNDEIRIVDNLATADPSTVDYADNKNDALQLFNTGTDLTTGTGTMTVKITYRVHTLGL